MASPVRTYGALYAHVARLTMRAIARRWYLLLLAPAVWWLVGQLITALVGVAGLAGGIVAAIVRAAGVSLLLFVARGLIEHRSFSTEDVGTGLGAFLGDVMTVYFTLWIGGLLFGQAIPPVAALLWFIPVVLPVFETVALSSSSGFGVFAEAWNFVRRDAPAWFAGHLPLLALVGVWAVLELLLMPLLRATAGVPIAGRVVFEILRQLPAALVFAAFVYRGILFLTLDGSSPRQRAQRFGGEPTLR